MAGFYKFVYNLYVICDNICLMSTSSIYRFEIFHFIEPYVHNYGHKALLEEQFEFVCIFNLYIPYIIYDK